MAMTRTALSRWRIPSARTAIAVVATCFGWLLFTQPVLARMNVVVIMTDDQRFDTVPHMPNVTALAARGVTFNNAYMPTPLCGPARASMFGGGFLAKNTGVLDNTPPNGGAPLFDDSMNFGRVMQQAGYQTLYVGKWINDHWRLGSYVPPGWSRFVGRRSAVLRPDWSNDIDYVIGSTTADSANGTVYTLAGQYLAYYERDQLLNFLGQTTPAKPFFVFWSAAAPHLAATPAPGDEGLFPNYLYRGRGYGETDLSDKPAWVRYRKATSIDDESVRNQLRSLQAVDRGIGAVIDKLRAIGQLENTLIVFTSDNGFQWGEHSYLWGKKYPYEESARVPLIVSMPGVAPRADTHLVAASLDLAPTIYSVAGVWRKSDGRSLVPLLRDPTIKWRGELFLEQYGIGNQGAAIWAGLRRSKWKYIRYWTGEEELYNLELDPFELKSRHAEPGLATLKTNLANRTTQLLGLAVLPVKAVPTGRVMTRYAYQFKTWGGMSPFAWKIESGRLPPGLSLNSATGTVEGTPIAAGSYTFALRVTDSSFASQAGRARTYVTGPLTLSIGT
jgi:N-acetylglucosamine-6-sulfatase